jgi:Sec-independent protein translocase protein TatA
MSILGLGMVEWALIAAVTALIFGIGLLPEIRKTERGTRNRGRREE